MLRKVIRIDEEKCDGCGQCVPACHEGALEIVDGKAKLVSDRYCDGLGDCLGECPRDAITLELREAEGYDEEAVQARIAARERAVAGIASAPAPTSTPAPRSGGGCPGSASRTLDTGSISNDSSASAGGTDAGTPTAAESQLGHWPVQLRLLHPAAPYLAGSDLVLCADCVPLAYPDFHRDYLRERTVAMGCPKLDDLSEMVDRLAAIFAHSQPRRVTVTRMVVPCCGGIAQAAVLAREKAGVELPIEVHTIDPHGRVVEAVEA